MRNTKMTLDEAVKYYINVLENDSPIVPRSHFVYANAVARYGDAFQEALDAYFEQRKEERKHGQR